MTKKKEGKLAQAFVCSECKAVYVMMDFEDGSASGESCPVCRLREEIGLS